MFAERLSLSELLDTQLGKPVRSEVAVEGEGFGSAQLAHEGEACGVNPGELSVVSTAQPLLSVRFGGLGGSQNFHTRGGRDGVEELTATACPALRRRNVQVLPRTSLVVTSRSLS
jgi:hypothetical protein